MIDWIALPLADAEPSVFASLMSQVFLWVKVAFGIGLVIFVHELGHFLAAKTFGVKCEKFYVGFDVPIKIGPIKFPRTLGKFQYGETEYGIGILPLGGYVKMLGQDDDPRKAKEEAERIRMESDEEDAPAELDPRSFPAKTVWQRMIIISAGVIVNVITGIMFAAIAFMNGVNYNPAIIGGVTPGGPAWEAGIRPGGQVIEVDGLKDEELHFREMRLAILTAGIDDPTRAVKLRIKYDDKIREVDLLTSPHPQNPDMRMIGITSPTSTTLSTTMYAAPGTVAADVLTDDDKGAKIVGFDGQAIDFDSIVPATPLLNYLNANPTKSVELELERADKSRHKITLPAQKRNTTGLSFAIGPVVAITRKSSAEKAGLEKGDVIISVDGNEGLDAFSLPVQLAGTTSDVTLKVRRGDKEIDLTLSPSDSLQTLSPTEGMGGEIALNAFGFAYVPTTTLSGSAIAEVKVGDVVKECKLVAKQEYPEEFTDLQSELLEEFEEWQFEDGAAVTRFYEAIQVLPKGTKLKLFFEKQSDGKIADVTVTVAEDEVHYRFERGVGLTATESVQTATGLGSAISLGLREGKRRLQDVVRFLGLMFRGRVNRKLVGGPIKIVKIAGIEAKRGISPQLLFLTMLSMNLAILNFLPIPALDGGHMVFLIAEAIRGKPVDEALQEKLTLVGVLALLALMMFVIFNDILTF